MAIKENSLWKEKDFVKTVSNSNLKENMEYFKEEKNEKKKYKCKKCKKPIGKHNLYWHEGLCNECFFDEHDI